MSYTFVDYPASGPDQGIVQDISPAAASGTAANAVHGSLKQLYNRFVQPTPTFLGVYEPLFEGAGGLCNISGTFAIAPNGGLISNTAGVNASGIINLPATPDYQQPWRFAALVQCGSDSHSLTIAVQNIADTSYASFVFNISGNGLNGAYGGTSGAFTLAETIAPGQKFWFTAASDGNRVIIASIPYGHAGINSSTAYEGNVLEEALTTVSATFTTEGHPPVFESLQQMSITTSSTTTILLGVFSIWGL